MDKFISFPQIHLQTNTAILERFNVLFVKPEEALLYSNVRSGANNKSEQLLEKLGNVEVSYDVIDDAILTINNCKSITDSDIQVLETILNNKRALDYLQRKAADEPKKEGLFIEKISGKLTITKTTQIIMRFFPSKVDLIKTHVSSNTIEKMRPIEYIRKKPKNS